MLGWCLMTNHVHRLVVPDREDFLSVLFRRVHGRYAQYLNSKRQRIGHLWQNRFFSCAVAPEREQIVHRPDFTTFPIYRRPSETRPVSEPPQGSRDWHGRI